MRLYDIALFVHMLGLIALFGGFVIYVRAGTRLRAAATGEQARTWLGLLQTTEPMFPSGLIMLLVSGIYMTATQWKSPAPWIIVALVTLVAMWALGATVQRRHLRAMRAAAEASPGGISSELARLIGDARPWGVMAALNGTALGIVWLMTTKPGWAGSIVVVAGAAALGAFIGSAAVRRGRAGAASQVQPLKS